MARNRAHGDGVGGVGELEREGEIGVEVQGDAAIYARAVTAGDWAVAGSLDELLAGVTGREPFTSTDGKSGVPSSGS